MTKQTQNKTKKKRTQNGSVCTQNGNKRTKKKAKRPKEETITILRDGVKTLEGLFTIYRRKGVGRYFIDVTITKGNRNNNP